MAIELSSAGVSIGYAVEATAGTRPTTGYTNIPSVKSIPDFNPEPSSLETTDLSQTEWKTYIPGLKDVGGALAITCNLTAAFKTAWESLVSAADTAKESSKATWFVVKIPGMTDSFYFAGVPSPLGLKAIDVDSVLEIDAYVTPTSFEGWATAPTGD